MIDVLARSSVARCNGKTNEEPRKPKTGQISRRFNVWQQWALGRAALMLLVLLGATDASAQIFLFDNFTQETRVPGAPPNPTPPPSVLLRQLTVTDLATGGQLPSAASGSLMIDTAGNGGSFDGTASVRGSFGGVAGTGQVDTLSLGASAQLTARRDLLVGPPQDWAYYAQAEAHAFFLDRITLSGGGGAAGRGFLHLVFAVHGTASCVETVAFACTSATFFSASSPAAFPQTFKLASGTTQIVFDVPYTFGVPDRLFIDLVANAVGQMSTPGTITATADFYNTATLLSVSVLDAAKQVLPFGFVESAAGLQYPTPVPEITSLTATPSVLSPRDHKLVPVSLDISVADSPVPVQCSISEITSNEALERRGRTDWIVTGPLTLSLRAKEDLVYMITVSCTNTLDRSASQTVTVRVLDHDDDRDEDRRDAREVRRGDVERQD